MIRIHKSFGKCKVGTKRETIGGREVFDATCENGTDRTLLIDKQYWGQPDDAEPIST